MSSDCDADGCYTAGYRLFRTFSLFNFFSFLETFPLIITKRCHKILYILYYVF